MSTNERPIDQVLRINAERNALTLGPEFARDAAKHMKDLPAYGTVTAEEALAVAQKAQDHYRKILPSQLGRAGATTAGPSTPDATSPASDSTGTGGAPIFMTQQPPVDNAHVAPGCEPFLSLPLTYSQKLELKNKELRDALKMCRDTIPGRWEDAALTQIDDALSPVMDYQIIL